MQQVILRDRPPVLEGSLFFELADKEFAADNLDCQLCHLVETKNRPSEGSGRLFVFKVHFYS